MNDHKKFRVGILGAGFISEFHIRVLKTLPYIDLVAVCDSDAGRAESVGRRHGIPIFYDPIARMPEGEVDVVHVLLPPPVHSAAAIECMKKRWNVFVEKPLAVSVSECREMQRAAEQYECTVGVNHNAIYQPAFQKLVEGIRQRRLGRVEHVFVCMNVPLRQLSAGQYGHWMFCDPGNIILEQAPHPLSQIQYLLGDFRSVAALPSGEVTLTTGALFYDTWQISAVCDRGSAQCFLSFGKEYFDFWIYAIGQDGAAFVDLRRNAVQFTEKTRFMPPGEQLYLASKKARECGGH